MELTNWHGAQRPARVTLQGVYARLEPLSVARHGAELFESALEPGADDRFRYLPDGTPADYPAFAAMRPGVPAREVDAVLRHRVLREGLRTDYRNVTGYTLGIYARTPRPSDFSYCFHPAAEWQLEAGMVFHMYVSARGLAFSESVLASAGGARRLTQHPRVPIIV